MSLDATSLSWLRLHLTPGLGRQGLFCLQEAFGSPQASLQAPAGSWQQAGLAARLAAALLPEDHPQLLQAASHIANNNVQLLSYWDSAYPQCLRQIADPPALLYVQGQLPAQPGFALVGSRSASPSGQKLAHDIARDLAEEGIPIVSGLALGIDAKAHEGALAAEGITLAVLGCGIDYIYPRQHTQLASRLLQRGALISEYPPGTPVKAGHFPGRNRIISGLSQGVLVVEASERSGALHTARFALEQGREVCAVPGAVQMPTSSGVNQLLKDGAALITSAEDILTLLYPARQTPRKQAEHQQQQAQLPPQMQQLYAQTDATPRHVDTLAAECGLTVGEVCTMLLDLELQGLVSQLPGMRYIRT